MHACKAHMSGPLPHTLTSAMHLMQVRLSRSRTGASGSALFVFDTPSIFQASGEMGDITGRRRMRVLNAVPPLHLA